MFLRGVLLTISRHIKWMFRLNHGFVISRNYNLWYLLVSSIPASSAVWDLWNYSFVSTLNQGEIFFRATLVRPWYFRVRLCSNYFSGSLVWGLTWPISPLDIFFTDSEKFGFLASQIFRNFSHHPLLYVPFICNIFWSVSLSPLIWDVQCNLLDTFKVRPIYESVVSPSLYFLQEWLIVLLFCAFLVINYHGY